MPKLTLQIELPEHCKVTEQEAKTIIVTKLYEDGKLSAGHGAEILGMTKREFIETFGTYCRMTPEDLDRELELLRRFTKHIDKKSPVKKEKEEYVFV